MGVRGGVWSGGYESGEWRVDGKVGCGGVGVRGGMRRGG